MENQNKDAFKFTYSAKQQEEINAIRKKYTAPQEDKMEQLRRLDRSVTQKGTLFSLILGILGALILGIGMSCVMVFEKIWFTPGIIIGVAGIVLISLAYPVYINITKKERERIAPEILRLTDELMK